MEASKRRLKQKQTLYPAKLGEEAEVEFEVLHDVVEDGETSNCLLDLTEKNLQRYFRMFGELAW